MTPKSKVFSIIFLLLLTACGTTPQPTQITPPTAIIPTNLGVTPVHQDSIDILNWMTQDENGCKDLVVNANHEILLNNCKGSNTALRQPEPLQIQSMVNHFSSFTYDFGKGKLTFNGNGNVSGEVWQRAIEHWVETTYAQDTTGHVCASCQTILAWNLGKAQNNQDMCKQLVVLDYGYAYGQKTPCTGEGQPSDHIEAWLETAEWTTLDAWLAHHLYTMQPEGYFSSSDNGGQSMSQDDIAKLKELAESIYNRITQISSQ